MLKGQCRVSGNVQSIRNNMIIGGFFEFKLKIQISKSFPNSYQKNEKTQNIELPKRIYIKQLISNYQQHDKSNPLNQYCLNITQNQEQQINSSQIQALICKMYQLWFLIILYDPYFQRFLKFQCQVQQLNTLITDNIIDFLNINFN
ncbi:unnamed protein product [Paramecium octaurelia]|uniref:Uncharacterized protein n=1 Tax=Paramecium octaurelia TaxID=43137 RepID=A0A8S1XXK3_PAROT|nr:unnamed protein product [Paramecium octaurelia]